MKLALIATGLATLLGAGTGAGADPVEVVAMSAEKTGMGWRVSVTLRHADTGWDHYADAWRIEDAEGRVLGTRELLHPHLTEQPFTRSLSSVMMPDGTSELHVRARCSVDGWNETTRAFPVTRGD
ncbi:hypothetical protein [Roseivivax isoporae]|uniref:Uncharacterized protein n=1 Tax=Roseivivax isoporae LMG 25204 TaxID=1449351 RepID=X7F4L8_9RHOB|nr:hypothetical protein [Roseivivax isoporae]ETX27760.1 hypothetical protein RISW2_11205 [Roseivivax isoporae LMG 25204]